MLLLFVLRLVSSIYCDLTIHLVLMMVSLSQGWEEITDAAITHLLRTCLAKSAKDQAGLYSVPTPPLPPPTPYSLLWVSRWILSYDLPMRVVRKAFQQCFVIVRLYFDCFHSFFGVLKVGGFGSFGGKSWSLKTFKGVFWLDLWVNGVNWEWKKEG